MKYLLSALAIMVPGVALAAGSDMTKPPKPTKTTKECKTTRVWDEDKQRCVRIKESSLSDDALMQTVRELAYAGRFQDAQSALAQMSDQTDDRVLTYWGFTNRKLGDLDTAMLFYTAALEQNPNNLLARSYMAQGMVETGDLEGAHGQLAQIETRGGGYTWAGTSLRQAIYTGKTFNY